MDIRQSDLDSLAERVKKRNYGKYLLSIKMSNVRSFENQQVNFDFPVTAIIGTNGGGKSTVLGAAALAYKGIRPGDFFPKSNIGDNSMANWRIDYEIIDRSIHKSGPFSRNARFVSAKWRRDNVPERDVIVIPIQRTVPANEQPKLKQFIGINQLKNVVTTKIDPQVAALVSRILGKDAAGYQRIAIKGDPSRSILVGVRKVNDYSQFHFGAGEASIIEMVSKIEGAEENSLIVIEEIENGLHPVATRKMVEYLIDVAKRKRVQIIFTTHSEYALDVLPPNAIWACIDGIAYQGKLSIESLRALTGSISKDKVVFVEDEFAKDLCIEMLRQYAPDLLQQTEVHSSGGYPYVVEVLKHHQKNPSVTAKAVALIDGDNPPMTEIVTGVSALPDGAPEAIVFGHASENAVRIASLIQQRCQCPSISQDSIVAALEKVTRDTTDHHLYFAKFGEELGFISEIVVRRGLCSIYVQDSASELKPIVADLRKNLTA